MTGLPGKWKPTYRYELRRRDARLRVTSRWSGKAVPVRACYRSSRGISGLFIEFYEATGVFALDEEIALVEEFSDCR